MANTDSFYIDNENRENLKERCKKRGDKSKIVNEALRNYFLPREETNEVPKLKVRVIG